MNRIKATKVGGAFLLAFAGWASLFTLIWLLILSVVQQSAGTAVALAFFFFVAVVATAVAD